MKRTLSKGLAAYNAKRKRQIKLQTEIELKDDLNEMAKIPISDLDRLNAYAINLTKKYPHDHRVFNAYVNWYVVKNKNTTQKGILDSPAYAPPAPK